MTQLNHRYKTHNTPTSLGQLTDSQLKDLGIESKEDRKLVLAAIHKARYKPNADPASAAAAGPSFQVLVYLPLVLWRLNTPLRTI